ncbi:DUF3159 domain-containing protein [Actinomycetospora lutea]|uniref:DUF3159 domain-containing protein n=1 Tax=Actinomycetospora lutea TaxID=663604 RepID=UPI0023653CE3|nr:DUF3159 domain-containing protein [Actinomycetospora lutea]MDD7940344.1 DUF3159 domain-containing protein [Actinomycetospora lutea]
MITEPRPVSGDPDADTAPVPVAGPAAPASPGAVILAQMGGWWGFVCTNIPAIVFSIANAWFPLLVTTAIALASAVALAVYRMAVRREKVLAASGGIIGVAIAGALTVWTGSPRDFFLVGVWAAFAATVALVVSLVARRPLTGLAWSWFHGKQFAWREDRTVLRAHDLATTLAAVVFAGRFAVNQTLYLADATGWLAVAKVVTGMPLTAVMALVVVWAFRRSTKRLVRGGRRV